MTGSSHRMPEWLRLEGTSGDPVVQLLCREGPPRARCTGSHPDFKCLQRRRLQSLSGQPVLGLCHPHGKEVFSHIQLDLPVLRFLPLVLSSGTTEESEISVNKMHLPKAYHPDQLLKCDLNGIYTFWLHLALQINAVVHLRKSEEACEVIASWQLVRISKWNRTAPCALWILCSHEALSFQLVTIALCEEHSNISVSKTMNFPFALGER